MLIIILLLFVFLSCLIKRTKVVERFKNSQKKFYILQDENTNFLITTLEKNMVVGYFQKTSIPLFEKLYKLNNCNICSSFEYIKLDTETKNIDWNEIHLVLLQNSAMTINGSKLLSYFPNSKFRDRVTHYFPNYEFVVENNVNNSVILLNPDPVFNNRPKKIPQSVGYDSDSNFVISGAINGQYFSKKHEDVIILDQYSLDNIEVKIGDTIIIDVIKTTINGKYTVFKVNEKIHMKKKAEATFDMYVCIDEDLGEHPHYQNKYSCESKYDASGEKKLKRMTWDTRCTRNFDCPFFNYDTDYGGSCQNGFCEFPPGLKPISYKTYKSSDNICEQQIK